VSSRWRGVPTPGFALAEVLAPEFALAQVLAHEFPLAEVPTPWLRLRRTHQCRCIRFQRHRLDTETSEIDRVGRRTHAAELLEHHQTRHGVSVHSQAPHCASASRSYDLREKKNVLLPPHTIAHSPCAKTINADCKKRSPTSTPLIESERWPAPSQRFETALHLTNALHDWLSITCYALYGCASL
jgi:hypothetical protein